MRFIGQMKHDQSPIICQDLGKGRLYHIHLQHPGWYCGLQGWKGRAFKVVVTRSNDYLGGVVRGRGVLAEDLRRSWVSCLLSAPASILPEKLQHSLSKQQALFCDREERNRLCFKKPLGEHKRCIVSKWVEGAGCFGGKRVELIPSCCLIMPDVIPVVMWVTTKPTAACVPEDKD